MKTFSLILQMIFTALLGGLVRPFRTANVEGAAGTATILTRRADAAHAYTHLLVKAGTDAGHVAVCGAANYPLGLTTDQPEAAEDLLNISPLGGVGKGTRKVRVASALAADIDLFAATNGFAQAQPGVVGTYYKVGRSVAAASQTGTNDYLIEFAPCEPRKLAVIATATGTAGTDIAALYTALQGSPDIIKSL